MLGLIVFVRDRIVIDFDSQSFRVSECLKAV